MTRQYSNKWEEEKTKYKLKLEDMINEAQSRPYEDVLEIDIDKIVEGLFNLGYDACDQEWKNCGH